MLYTSSLYRWLQRKRYQYEVTFSLYMLTPIEKFIFSMWFSPLMMIYHLPSIVSRLFRNSGLLIILADSFLLLFISMIIIAASLYLPEHISTITKRAWFYWAGDEAAGVKSGVLAEQQSTLAMSPAGSDDAWMQREL